MNPETTAVAVRETPAGRAQPSLAPQTFNEALTFAKLLAQSDFVPKAFHGKPADILAAIQFGFELGVGPMQALQNVAVINGKPTVYGDLALALVQASGLLEYIKERDDGQTATCETKRRDYPAPCITTFSNEDAKRAGLLGKAGPWTQYPARMRMFRARGFNLRDNYADVLKGLITREEAEDYPTTRQYGPETAPAGVPEPAIDTSATQVNDDSTSILMNGSTIDRATGEIIPPKPTDKATPVQRKALIDAAHRAMNRLEGDIWLHARLDERGYKKWGEVTVGDIETLTRQLVEFTSLNQEPPPADDSGNIDFPEEDKTNG